MEVEFPRPENPAMTFDEVSMERSKNFVKALQELKNLRPQLYSAAEYCEKSYLQSEQKQMVLDNLKDYAVRALVNAVDHLGTVAYKLTDLLEQQTLEVSTMELKASCLNQQLLMCQTYTDKEGLRQQQLLAFIPRHHKHYILPNSVNKKVHFSPHIQTDPRQNYFQAKSRLQPSGIRYSCIKNSFMALSLRNQVYFERDFTTFGKEPTSAPSGRVSYLQILSACVELEGSKPLTAFRSFDNPKHEIIRAPVRSRSMLSAFFAKQKAPKLKAGYVA
ncbi:hypothetical protein QQP08_003515 [Theobroma cacao]|nr:hypothetical protein QQP08_003515 [Theobroma cacao]